MTTWLLLLLAALAAFAGGLYLLLSKRWNSSMASSWGFLLMGIGCFAVAGAVSEAGLLQVFA